MKDLWIEDYADDIHHQTLHWTEHERYAPDPQTGDPVVVHPAQDRSEDAHFDQLWYGRSFLDEDRRTAGRLSSITVSAQRPATAPSRQGCSGNQGRTPSANSSEPPSHAAARSCCRVCSDTGDVTRKCERQAGPTRLASPLRQLPLRAAPRSSCRAQFEVDSLEYVQMNAKERIGLFNNFRRRSGQMPAEETSHRQGGGTPFQ